MTKGLFIDALSFVDQNLIGDFDDMPKENTNTLKHSKKTLLFVKHSLQLFFKITFIDFIWQFYAFY